MLKLGLLFAPNEAGGYICESVHGLHLYHYGVGSTNQLLPVLTGTEYINIASLMSHWSPNINTVACTLLTSTAYQNNAFSLLEPEMKCTAVGE